MLHSGRLNAPPEVRQERRWVQTVQIPFLRFAGFLALLAFVFLDNIARGTFADRQGLWPFAAIVLAYCAVSWLLLRLLFDETRKPHLGRVFLTLDIVAWVVAIYFTGAETSWFLPLLVLRSADQMGAGYRAVHWYGHVATACYLTLLAYLAFLEGRTLAWPIETLKVVGIYAVNWYLASCARAAEVVRNRIRDARESAEKASVAKSEFLAAMSHEVRTPLHGMMATYDLLLETGLTDEQRKYVEMGRQCSVDLVELVNGLLDLSKIEARAITVTPSDFDLRALVDGVLELARTAARDKPIEVHREFGPHVPVRIRADRGHLRRILLNLVLNGVKYTSRGSVEMTVHTSPLDGEGWELRVEIADTGVGIPTAARVHIFEPYYRVRERAGDIRDGTGLGLTISKSLVEAMGGRIGFRSQTGVGTTFWFDLPVAAPVSDAAKEAEPAIAAQALDTADKRILVVEDNPIVCRVLVRLIESLGYPVDAVSNGVEAMSVAVAGEYSLIFMDRRLPGIDGLEATRRIRKAEGTRRRTPIVALTADATQEDVAQFLAAGADECLSKPVAKQALASLLGRRFAEKPRASGAASGN